MGVVSTFFSALFFFSPFFSQSGDASFYFEKGTVEFDNAMYSYAEENLSKAVSLDPSLFRAFEMLGDIRLRQERRQEALSFYDRSLSANEAQDRVHFKAGEIEDFFINNAKALSHFVRACELNPSNVYAAAGAARMLSLQKKEIEAEKYYQQSYSAGRAEEEKHLKRYSAAKKKNDYYSEETSLADAIEANPVDSDAYYLLASIHRSRKNNGKAAAVLEKLKFMRPLHAKVYVLLAHLYYSERIYRNRKKEIETAAAYMETALSWDPSNTEHLEFLAELSRAAGQEEKARLYEERSRISARIDRDSAKPDPAMP